MLLHVILFTKYFALLKGKKLYTNNYIQYHISSLFWLQRNVFTAIFTFVKNK